MFLPVMLYRRVADALNSSGTLRYHVNSLATATMSSMPATLTTI